MEAHANCIFCKIVRGELKTPKIYEDDLLIAFNDIAPKAPVHFLVIPKTHIESLLETNISHQELLGRLNVKLTEIAKAQGLSSGFKVAVNVGAKGGQEVMHLHYHVTGHKE